MRLFLDTHFVVWLARFEERLSTTEQQLLASDGVRLLISPAAIWELRIKWNRSGAAAREELLSPEDALAYAELHGVEVPPLSGADCAASLAVPLRHRDPFDEMLLIHAQQLGARLLTRDRALAGHPLAWRPEGP